jgi:hypothetical protein
LSFCASAAASSAERQWICRWEYERIRASSVRFPIAPGHELPDIETVVEANERYTVVEKLGRAAEVVAALDPRS